ncbi:MAG: zf-HC2 domain-containing protein [Acidimicrobiia bacterium]|nr:zf-HC2 domain-containing protein [Acidimicrobiia bacterium]MDH5236245.1 zf-HC2 domain-containing protein [Acidimicrobiia bacterium]
MPDPLLPRGPADDGEDALVSAYLDGEATAEEAARVEASPRLLAQVAAFGSVADLVASDPVDVDDVRREQHIAAALAAAPTAANVTAMTVGRSDRRPWYRQPLVAVAAAIVALAVAVPALSQLTRTNDNDVAGSAADESESAESATEDRDRQPGRSLTPAPAGDATDLTEGDGGFDPANGLAEAAPAATAAPNEQYARLVPDDSGEFTDLAAAVAAYDTQADEADDDTAALFEDSAPSAADNCLDRFDAELPVLVATVGGTDFFVGRAGGVTIAVEMETCTVAFGD